MMAARTKKEKTKQEFKSKTQAAVVWSRFRRNKLALFGLIVFIVMMIAVLGADLYLDYDMDALEINMSLRYQSPSAEHIMGTDMFGRDLFARVMYGGRISMFVGIATVMVSLSVGSLIGATAAYYGGHVDNILMRVMDVFLAIPSTLLAIAIISALGTSLLNLIVAMGISQIPRMSRIVRSVVLGIKDIDYVEAASAYGSSDMHIIFKHIIPNAMGPILVQVTQTVARSVLTISGLSFVGLGVSEPTPEWGTMLSTVKTQMWQYPYLAIYPGIAIVLSVMSLTLIGDGLRDAMDPRLRN